MTKIYADLIRKGVICPKTGKPYSIEDVPSKLRKTVKKILDDASGEV